MPAKKANRVSAIAAAVFTSVVAPTLVAVFTTAIKGDTSVKAASVSPSDQSVVVRRDAPTTPAVTLLPPVIEHASRKSTSVYAPMVQPQAWRPDR